MPVLGRPVAPSSSRAGVFEVGVLPPATVHFAQLLAGRRLGNASSLVRRLLDTVTGRPQADRAPEVDVAERAVAVLRVERTVLRARLLRNLFA